MTFIILYPKNIYHFCAAMKAVKPENVEVCYHCGENCETEIRFDEKTFCCEGCKTVYSLLSENNLCNYYNLNQTPGVSLNKEINNSKFAYLDDEQIRRKLLNFNDGNLSSVTFYIPQIHCSSCIFLLENLYRLKQGILRSNVNFLKREVNLTFQNNILSLRQVVEALAQIGYEPKINLNEKNQHLQRYYTKIGVAFFAFGNIMLLSFPEYLGIDIIQESSFRKFFGYLNFALALPVLFYSAEEFFTSAWNAAKEKTLNMDVPIALGIVAMFIRSCYEIFSHTGAGYFDTLASLVLLMLIGRLFQNKTYDTLSFERDYQSYFPIAVTVLNTGEERSVPLTKIVVGNRLLIRNQELIPVDGILVKGNGNIDYSFVTGEATPIAKQSGDLIFAGGKHLGSAIEIEVTKDVSHSYLTQLWNNSIFQKQEQQNISSLASKMSRWFTPIVLFIAIAAAIFWWNKDVSRAINAFTSVLIITCPCALALSSPFTLGNVLRLLNRSGIHLKNTFTIEKLAQIRSIVFDKTGTLTNTKNARIEFVAEGESLSEDELSLIKSLVFHSSHPLSKKVYEHLKEISKFNTNDFKEIEGKGIEGFVNENSIKIGSKRFLVGDKNTDNSEVSDFRHASKVYVGINGNVRGFFLIKNEYRKGFGTLMQLLRERFYVFVLSGDNDAEKNFLKQHVNEENLAFHHQPQDKLNYIKNLQQQGKSVMMIGDGLNDAGALKQADVGLVIADDINNFSPACDGIVEAEQFEKLNALMQFSKDGVRVIKMSFAISILYNLAGVALAIPGTMSPIVAAIIMPLSSVTIILFTTLGAVFYGKKRGF
ncbi:MAG TPA: heavy metal translocating P-type ATPase metal-binding domain-containing protein [Chitinophagales bacterium]|nr:heavy metal translocating P-type ATPase metal-binding domain-containing protein [Chitinophagales bacterium]